MVVEVRSFHEPRIFFGILSKWLAVHAQLLAVPKTEVDHDGSEVWTFKVQFNRNPSEWFLSVAEKFTSHRPVLTVCERDRSVDWNPEKHKLFLELLEPKAPCVTPPRAARVSAKGLWAPARKGSAKAKSKAKAKAVEEKKEVVVMVAAAMAEEEKKEEGVVAEEDKKEKVVAEEEVPRVKRQKQAVDDDEASESEPEPDTIST